MIAQIKFYLKKYFNKLRPVLVYGFLVALLIASIVYFYGSDQSKDEVIPYSERKEHQVKTNLERVLSEIVGEESFEVTVYSDVLRDKETEELYSLEPVSTKEEINHNISSNNNYSDLKSLKVDNNRLLDSAGMQNIPGLVDQTVDSEIVDLQSTVDDLPGFPSIIVGPKWYPLDEFFPFSTFLPSNKISFGPVGQLLDKEIFL